MEMFRNLGPALRLIREERRLTQAELARAAAIGKSQLSKYESGKEKPKLESLEKLLSVLSVRPVDLFAIMNLLGLEFDRIDPIQGSEPTPATTRVPLGPGVLSARVQDVFIQVHQDLLRLHSVLVGETVTARRNPESP
jgi:transcriptional regulator with XRE-family HTH domain